MSPTGSIHWAKFGPLELLFVALIFLYMVMNLVLAVMSTQAWTKGKSEAEDYLCLSRFACNFTRWGLWVGISVAAFTSLIITVITVYRMSFRGFGRGWNRMNIARSILITLALFFPLIILGWLPPVISDETSDMPLVGNAHQDEHILANGGGLTGAFIFARTRFASPAERAAYHVVHITFAFGSLIASLVTALAPPTVPLVEETPEAPSQASATA